MLSIAASLLLGWALGSFKSKTVFLGDRVAKYDPSDLLEVMG